MSEAAQAALDAWQALPANFMMSRRLICSLASFAVLHFQNPISNAEVFGGIEFPQGRSSFADEVIRYVPLFGGGPGPTEPTAMNSTSSLGVTDYPPGGSVGTPGAVSLGKGGLLELRFVNNLLTNSASPNRDVYIFEVGPQVEDTFVAIRPLPETAALLGNPSAHDANGDGFYEIGKVFGSTASIDIDAIFPGFPAGTLRFDAVQLIDDPAEGATTGPTVGADIDAVGAISSVLAPIPMAIFQAVWLEWNSTSALLYQIQGSVDLESWTDIGLPIAGTGSLMTFCEKISTPKKFFRVIGVTP